MSRASTIGIVLGAAGALLCGLGCMVNPAQFFYSYLVAYVFWVGLALGCLGLLMIHHLTGGGWGFLIRRFLEAGIGTLPLGAALSIPLFFGLGYLYSWARPGPHDEMLSRKLFYLNTPGFALRTAIVFVLWIGLSFFLRRWSREQDATTDAAPTRRMRTLSGPGIVLFAVLGTVAAVDWVMVLENDWTSTIFPIQMMIGQMAGALALSIILLVNLQGSVKTEELHRLGNLLLAFVMLWAYMAVSQLIIIWSGNLPREISWYLHRVAGGWKALAIGLGLFHFGVPFAILLWREAKRRPAILARIAAGVLVAHAAEVFWQIAPSLHPTGFVVSWLDPAAFVAVGGFWSANYFWLLRRAPLLATNDPREQPALEEAAHV